MRKEMALEIFVYHYWGTFLNQSSDKFSLKLNYSWQKSCCRKTFSGAL
jgi:hypothetical protein